MSHSNKPGLRRRGFLTASATGLAAVGVGAAGLGGSPAGPGGVPEGHLTRVAAGAAGASKAGPDLATAVLDAFKTHQLVGLGESHDLQEHHDLLQTLMSDPRLPGAVDDIVVEFGNALYQDTIDKFVLGDEPVTFSELRPTWENTTQSPMETWDAPVYEQFYRRVRALNWTLPPGKRIRVLLGDPPINWARTTTTSQWAAFLRQRETYPASVIEQQVLAKARRALVCYGSEHLLHTNAVAGTGRPLRPTIVSRVEEHTGVPTYTIIDLTYFKGDPDGLAAKLTGYRRNTVIPCARTWLGSFDAGLAIQAFNPVNHTSHFCGIPLGKLLDAGWYLGQPGVLTASTANPDIYFDPAYWNELKRRNAISGPVDLESYRQPQSAPYPQPAPPNCPSN